MKYLSFSLSLRGKPNLKIDAAPQCEISGTQKEIKRIVAKNIDMLFAAHSQNTKRKKY